MTETFLSHFTPSLMSADTLEQMLVQRQELAQELVDRIRESATTPVKHYTLLIGPRGIGKTHLISLIYHRVCQQENLRGRLLIAWLSEDNWSITSFLKLIVSIFSALKKEYPKEYKNQLQQKVENLYSSPDTAEETAVELLKDFIGDRTLLLLVENLDQIFDGLGEAGQKQFLAFLQKSNCCTIIATSPSLFNDVNNKKTPFYNFFCIQDLRYLTAEDAAQLLINVATIQGDLKLKDFISSPNGKARIKTVHHLAGGNPRVYVIFYQFLTCESLDELVKPFMRMLDDLTPYYQSRMQSLSPQQREIVELLCARRYPVSVKEIAERCFITHQTASSQLKTLRNLGYVTSEAIGRESYYQLREVLMRFCLDVKNRSDTIPLIVNFLRLWYAQEELQQQLELGIANNKYEMGVDISEQLLNIGLNKLPFELIKVIPSNTPIELKYLCHALAAVEQDDEDPRIAAYLQEYKNFYAKEDYVNALQITDKLIEINGSVDHWYNRSLVLVILERFEEAIASCNKVIEITPECYEAWYIKGVALTSLGQFEEAISSCAKAIEITPDFHEVWNIRGFALKNLGRFEEEIACYAKAIEFKPDDHKAWSNRGSALYNLGRFEEALASYDKAIEFQPDFYEAWYNRGSVLVILDRFEEGIASLDKAIEIKPDYHEAWYNRGSVLLILGRFEEALASYDKAIEIKPDYHEAWYTRGFALTTLKRFEEALASYNKAIEIKPDYHEAWYNRGGSLLILGRFEEALASYDKAVEIKPDYYDAWCNRGWALKKLGRFEEALISFDKALEIDPNNAIAWEDRGRALNQLNRTEKEEAKLKISQIFNSKQDREVWRSRLTTLVNIYENHNVLPALGQGLVNHIPEIMSEMISDKAARIWLEVWQEQTSKFDDFQIPLRLLNAAVRYRETKGDRRALLELPIEERKLLQSILDLDQ